MDWTSHCVQAPVSLVNTLVTSLAVVSSATQKWESRARSKVQQLFIYFFIVCFCFFVLFFVCFKINSLVGVFLYFLFNFYYFFLSFYLWGDATRVMGRYGETGKWVGLRCVMKFLMNQLKFILKKWECRCLCDHIDIVSFTCVFRSGISG